MSVEHALKRELAYCEKLARLYPDDDSIKHFLPLQVPSAAKTSSANLGSSDSLGQSSLSTEVHQISISNPLCQKPSSTMILSPNSSLIVVLEPRSMAGVGQQQSIPPNSSCQKLSLNPIPGPGPGPVSDLTNVASHQVPSPMPSINHPPSLKSNMASTGSTTKETVTASSFQHTTNQHPESFQISNDTNLFCKVCKVSCSSSFNYKEHVRGQKHKTKLKMQLRGGNSTRTFQQPRCNLCQIWCTDENTLRLHFDGQKHKAKLKEIELRQKGIVLHQQLWCELCQVPCSNEDSFRMHLRGKNHITRLYNTRG